MFKDNSRFSSLIEDKPKHNKKSDNISPQIETKKEIILDSKKHFFNSFKNEPPTRHSFNRNYDNINYEREEYNKKLEENRKKEEEILKKSLSIESFPILTSIKKQEIVENKMNFIEKIEKQNIIEETKIEINHLLKQGWSEIKLNKKTNQIKIFYNMKKNINMKSELESAYEVLNNLVYLHEKRRDEYIEKWGYDEWEHYFEFPNYDYCYFDKLDEIYEESNQNYLDNEEEYEY